MCVRLAGVPRAIGADPSWVFASAEDGASHKAGFVTLYRKIQQNVTVCGPETQLIQSRLSGEWRIRMNEPKQNKTFTLVNNCICGMTCKSGPGSTVLHQAVLTTYVFWFDISVVRTLLKTVSTLVWGMGMFLLSGLQKRNSGCNLESGSSRKPHSRCAF